MPLCSRKRARQSRCEVSSCRLAGIRVVSDPALQRRMVSRLITSETYATFNFNQSRREGTCPAILIDIGFIYLCTTAAAILSKPLLCGEASPRRLAHPLELHRANSRTMPPALCTI
jgi:hypothetical protein